MADSDEIALERLEDVQDELEEIIRAAEERDGKDYFKDLRIRVRKAAGRYYLALTWYRSKPPSGSVIYAPYGCWLCQWYKILDKQGVSAWESGLEVLSR